MIDCGRYVGIPYAHGGRTRAGLDCLGLVWLVLRDHGVRVPDGDGRPYTPDWFKVDPGRYLRGLLAHGEAAPLDDLRPMDLVYFRMGGAVSHAGVMVDSECFIHVLEGRSVCVSRLNSMWRRRLAGARRFL